MTKKQKDINAYFVSNKRRKDDVVENNSGQSATDSLYDIDANNAPESVNNKEVLTERSFSILKLIKTKLSNRTGHERLSDLATISINKNIAPKLNIESIIDEFVKSKRKISFNNEPN
jgi:hypothetical protein